MLGSSFEGPEHHATSRSIFMEVLTSDWIWCELYIWHAVLQQLQHLPCHDWRPRMQVFDVRGGQRRYSGSTIVHVTSMHEINEAFSSPQRLPRILLYRLLLLFLKKRRLCASACDRAASSSSASQRTNVALSYYLSPMGRVVSRLRQVRQCNVPL